MGQQEHTDRFIKLPEVLRITARSTASIYADMKETPPRFPRQVRIGRHAVAWKLSEISAWMQQREKESRGGK